jgi:mannan endo-1,4-beta-mannosidase
VLYAYSPGTESDGDPEKYMERYPGDDIIDVLGVDTYCGAPDGDSVKIAAYAQKLDKHLAMIETIAKAHGKALALTETGYEGIPQKQWWTKTLAPVLAKHPVAYVVVWRNAREKPTHHFAPYPGHASAADFVSFYNLKKTLFLRDVNALYLDRK